MYRFSEITHTHMPWVWHRGTKDATLKMRHLGTRGRKTGLACARVEGLHDSSKRLLRMMSNSPSRASCIACWCAMMMRHAGYGAASCFTQLLRCTKAAIKHVRRLRCAFGFRFLSCPEMLRGTCGMLCSVLPRNKELTGTCRGQKCFENPRSHGWVSSTTRCPRGDGTLGAGRPYFSDKVNSRASQALRYCTALCHSAASWESATSCGYASHRRLQP